MDVRRATADIRYMNQVLPAAEREAAQLGDDLPGVEHLVLGAAAVPGDDTARTALAAVGIDGVSLRDAVRRVHDEALAAVGIAGSSPHAEAAVPRLHRSTGPAQEAFQAAVAVAKAEGRAVRGADLVVAATGQELGTFARALGLLGVAPDDLAGAARAALQDEGRR